MKIHTFIGRHITHKQNTDLNSKQSIAYTQYQKKVKFTTHSNFSTKKNFSYAIIYSNGITNRWN